MFASRGHIPKGSLAAGKGTNGDALYACRARLANGSEQPGRIRQPMLGCAVTFGGLEWSIGAYQVLRDDGPKTIKWVNGKEMPKAPTPWAARSTAPCFTSAGRSSATAACRSASWPPAPASTLAAARKNAADFEVLVKP